MKRYRCRSCEGVYDVDGGDYYHVCPPGTENPRDENVRGGLGEDRRKMKAEGTGRREVKK